MSEESRNGKFRRKRTAIYYLKRLVGSFALQMYLFRYMFFACSVVSQYHNSHVAFGKQIFPILVFINQLQKKKITSRHICFHFNRI